MTTLFSGPMATITVNSTDFNLPRELLCYNSSFFNKSLNGNFKEAREQKVKIDASIDAFKLVVKWIYTRNIVFSVLLSPSNLISRLLEFLLLADFLQLLGPFDSIANEIKGILSQTKSSRNFLTSGHIRQVMQLPLGHEARKVVIQACVKLYMDSIYNTSYITPLANKTCKFEKEVTDFHEFAAELFRAYDQAMRNKRADEEGTWMKDPLTGKWICYQLENFEVADNMD